MPLEIKHTKMVYPLKYNLHLHMPPVLESDNDIVCTNWLEEVLTELGLDLISVHGRLNIWRAKETGEDQSESFKIYFICV